MPIYLLMNLNKYKVGYDMRNNNFSLWTTRCLTLAFVLLFLPLISYSAQLFYTIQTASFTNMSEAEEKFNAIAKKLNEEERDHLRIEKIGKFYTVRLGKFDDYKTTSEFLNTIKAKISQATVMDAYIKEERIKKIFKRTVKAEKQPEKDEVTAIPEPDKTTPDITEEAVNHKKPVSLKETMATIKTLVGEKDYAAALEVIRTEVSARTDHPDLNAWHGMVLLKMDQPSEALKYLEKATELSPDVPDYHNGLGYSFFFLNRFDKAIDEFNKAVSLDPGYFDALTGLCISYAKNGNKEDALDIYEKIKDFDRDTSDKLRRIIEMTM
jgi:tetratricopeptide (TPR) repeat protein